MFYKIRRQKTEEQYRSLYRQLVSSLESSDKIYFTVSTQDDANIIRSAYEQYRNLVQQKLIILIHNTPTLVESNILQGVTVIGCFSTLYASYVIDFDIILGRTEINPARHLTISLGGNGSVYDHKKSDFSFALNSPEYKLLPFYATAKEKTLTEENKELKDNIKYISSNFNDKKNRDIIVIIILSVIIIILILYLFFSRKKNIAVIQYHKRIIGVIKKTQFSIAKVIVSICVILFLIMIAILWYSVGEDLLSNDKELLAISETILCAAYRHPKTISSIIIILAIIVLTIINFPNDFQNVISIFRQKGNKTAE
jgi:hypothetical protein